MNALNASNISFKQQFSELCDDMKINSNNSQVSRYNDLRRFVNQILDSSNISYSGNNSDCSRSVSNSSKRNSDIFDNRPNKISRSEVSQIEMLDDVINNLHDRHNIVLDECKVLKNINFMLLEQNKELEEKFVDNNILHNKICELTAQGNSWKDKATLFEAKCLTCLHMKVTDDVLSENNCTEAKLNKYRFEDEKIRTKELDRKILGYIAKIQILKCEISKLVGEGKTLHAIHNKSLSDSSSTISGVS